MNKNKLLTGKILLPMLLALILTIVIVPMEKASPTPTTTAQTILYLEATNECDCTSGSDPNSAWNIETNAWDQTDETYANRTSNATEDNEATRIEGTGNTAPSTGPAITRVEIGVKHYCTNRSVITKVKLRPVFGGADLGNVHEINSRKKNSTDYVNITNDINAPSTWTWSDVQNLDVRVWGKWENPKDAETLYIDQIKVRVTCPPTTHLRGINEIFTVNIMIRNASAVHGWGMGMIFDPDILNCTGFHEGEFLSDVASTTWNKGGINNNTGRISSHGSFILGDKHAMGDGRLAYATFKVIAPGVSDLHLRDVEISELRGSVPFQIPLNIIDIFTVVVGTTPHTVVIVNNSTGKTGWYHSGLYDHFFNLTLKEISFKVTGPHLGFANVTIPKTLLNVTTLDNWIVIVDGIPLSTEEKRITENATHTSIYFTYSLGIHKIQITTRPLTSSIISITLSENSTTLGSSVTINGTIIPLRTNVNVTIKFRLSGEADWSTLAMETTDQNGNYSYDWEPDETGTYEVKARWNGDVYTLGDESDMRTLKVLGTPVRRWSFEVTVEGEVFEVVIKSNFTVSGFAFNDSLNEIYFNVDGMAGNTYVCNITIPKEVLWCDDLGDWVIKIDGVPPSVSISKNETHTSISFTFTASIHYVQITTKISTISMNLSSTNITLGESVTISGAIDPLRLGENVTIQYRLNDGNWTSLVNMTTHSQYGNYSYDWTPETAGTYEVEASWDGDPYTNPAESEVKTLTVEEEKEEGIPLEIVMAVVVVVIVIAAAVVVYFVKFRKSR